MPPNEFSLVKQVVKEQYKELMHLYVEVVVL